MKKLMCVAGVLLVAAVVLAGVRDDTERVVKRLQEIRGAGMPQSGPGAVLQKVRISEDDYYLMGCDCSCAARNHPEVSKRDREEGRWWAGGDDLKDHDFGNSEGTIDAKTGKEIIESFYSAIPKAEYQSSPEEVAWYYFRVKELRKQNIPTNVRIEMIKKEAVDKPWIKN